MLVNHSSTHVCIRFTHLPVISDATFPKAVVVVVAAYWTPLRALLNNRVALALERLGPAPVSLRVSVRPGTSVEFWYSVTRILTAAFWSEILSIRHNQTRVLFMSIRRPSIPAYDLSWNFPAMNWMENFSKKSTIAQRKNENNSRPIKLMIAFEFGVASADCLRLRRG